MAQLIDYGSHLWNKSLKQFEDLVEKYFDSVHRTDPDCKYKTLGQAVRVKWGIEQKEIEGRLTEQLQKGNITYVLAAQRFTPSMERNLSYMNHVSAGPRFFAAKIVRFLGKDCEGQDINAFECHIVAPPNDTGSTNRSRTNRMKLLDAVKDDLHHRKALEKLLDYASELALSFHWGTLGVSIRLNGQSGPITIAGCTRRQSPASEVLPG